MEGAGTSERGTGLRFSSTSCAVWLMTTTSSPYGYGLASSVMTFVVCKYTQDETQIPEEKNANV